MHEVIKFLVDNSVKNGVDKYSEVSGSVVPAIKLSDSQAIYLCEDEVWLARNLNLVAELDIYTTTKCALIGEAKNVNDQIDYLFKFIKDASFISLFDFMISESFEKHLDDISNNYFFTDVAK